MPKLSLLDLVFVNENQSIGEAIHDSVKTAQAVEEFGFDRIWIAEHHNMPSIASAATSVVIGHLAAHTKKIRIGAGGIMLPNHSPFMIAEQFGTLNSLFPGRIDLGLGRAPGTDQATLQALRTDPRNADNFPNDVQELQYYFSKTSKKGSIIPTPGQGEDIPLWILGSSTFGASLAAKLGLPYAFASHFAPDAISDALDIYRAHFTPSQKQAKPYAMTGINVIIADTQEEAEFLSTSQKQSFANLRRGVKMKFQPPIDDINDYWYPQERAMAEHMLKFSFIGTKEKVKSELDSFISTYKPDELMVVSSIYDTNKRINSLKMLSDLF